MAKLFKYSILFLAISLLVSFAAGITLYWTLLDRQPLVTEAVSVQPETLKLAKWTLKRLYRQLRARVVRKRILLRLQELDGLSALASRLVPGLAIQHKKQADSLLVSASVRLPRLLKEQYLNISATFSDENNPEDNVIRIGHFELSLQQASRLLFSFLYLYFDQPAYGQAQDLLQKIAFKDSYLAFYLNPDIDTRQLVESIMTTVKKDIRNMSGNSEFDRVEFYYLKLAGMAELIQPLDEPLINLFDVMQPIFIDAARASRLNNPVEENTYALLALALLCGDHQLRRFLRTALDLNFNTPVRLSTNLLQRKDLALHFLYSAVIKVMTDRHISTTIGEIKEINDLRRGGSGFSFVDIAADRAGIRFAEQAVDPQTAILFQKSMQKVTSESSLMPEIFALPEGMSQQQFKFEYENTDSAQYRAVLAEIDRRIRALQLYRRVNGKS